MFTLLLDTSNTYLSIGLAKDHKVVDSISYEAWQKQSEFLIQELDAILSRNNLSREDIGMVISAKGPGSYTGVRIALTVAKVIAFALNVPLYLVSSLEVLKDEAKPSICLMNARSKRSYFGVYEGETIIVEDKIVDNQEALKYIAEHPEYKVCGEVAYLGFESTELKNLEVLANSDIERNLCADPVAAKPVYLKDLY
ncbi:MAG: tRNA (adenosine(37)-N6)-threonylcarbamoyltransferase complex dimerization subunit type 1 TsaB [Bacilli bacterium]|nr:tRNA (adenosine(37)-N6)-threonylcarbamoyltransferase complex dimerization subunit type 1 TsaB [Bacilli bacterium]